VQLRFIHNGKSTHSTLKLALGRARSGTDATAKKDVRLVLNNGVDIYDMLFV